jgi:hypothetical protein
MEILEGSTLSLPVANMWEDGTKLDRRLVSLIQSSASGHVLSDCYKKIKVVKKDKGHFFLLQAESMQQGNYVLRLSGEKETRIDIQVHRGKFWNGLDNVIVKNNCIREITSS